MTPNSKRTITNLEQRGQSYNLPEGWLQARPHLVSAATVPLSSIIFSEITETIEAIESVIKIPDYQARVLSWASEIARFDPGIPGVFFSYDFHLSPDGPKLIEINSNAGAAALVTALLTENKNWEAYITHVFLNEWKIKRGDTPLSCVAIVDDDPKTQYLYPDFLLFQFALQKHGIKTIIADPQALHIENQQLYCEGVRIELVYNRLTDFSLKDPTHQILRNAYLADMILLTPHPRAHAVYADKRNLMLLSDTALLRSWGVSEAICAQLHKHIPHTYMVNTNNAETLWDRRRELFFKPVASYGGKGAYRGAKISRPKFNEILQHNYIAQTFVPPSEQLIKIAENPETFKVDIRIYTYEGKSIGMAARLYQGQVTNMRTLGGGYAAITPD